MISRWIMRKIVDGSKWNDQIFIITSHYACCDGSFRLTSDPHWPHSLNNHLMFWEYFWCEMKFSHSKERSVGEYCSIQRKLMFTVCQLVTTAKWLFPFQISSMRIEWNSFVVSTIHPYWQLQICLLCDSHLCAYYASNCRFLLEMAIAERVISLSWIYSHRDSCAP